MEGNTTSRRDVLRTGAALSGLAVTASLSGCSAINSLIGGGTGTGQVKKLPEDTEMAVSIDIDAILEDDGTKDIVNASIEAQAAQAEESYYGEYNGPEDFDDALSQFEDEYDLDPKEVDLGTMFFEYNEYGSADSEYAGFVFKSGWSEDDIVDAIEEGGSELDEDEHNGKTVYESESDYNPTYLGVLGDNQYVVGSEDAVEDVIDVRTDGGDKMDEELRNGFTSTKGSAPFRFVSEIPDDTFPDEYGYGDDAVDVEGFDEAIWVAGSVYTDGDTRGVDVTIKADEEGAAEDMGDTIDAFLTFGADQIPDDDLADEVDAIEVEQNGKKVTINYETTVDDITGMIEDAYEN
jgi:hypothetical protein